MAQFELALESWDSFWPEAQDLFEAHHREIGDAAPLEVDDALASTLQNVGALVIASARTSSAGPLVGYCIFFLATSLEHRGRLCANQGPWFVAKESRGSLGLRLFKFALKELGRKGVTQVFAHYWPKSDPRLSSFFASLGGVPQETVFSLSLPLQQKDS